MRIEKLRTYFLPLLLLWTFGATNAIAYFVLDQIPHVEDSIAQLFHAKIFATGQLTAESHPLREFFDYTHMINDGRWYSQYPPGHTLMLMLGVLLGAPWLINPLLGTLAVWVTYHLAKELYSPSVAMVAALLAALSPFLLFLSAGFMSHSTSMLSASLFALGFVKVVKYHSLPWGAIAGAGLGFCILTRPYSALGVSIPFLVVASFLVLNRRTRRSLRPLLVLSSVTVFFIALLMLFNQLTNGSPLTFGYRVLYGPELGLGFGKALWLLPPHTFGAGVSNTLTSFEALNLHLLGWPHLSLLPMLLLFILGQARRWDWLLLSSGLSLAGVYLFYWYQDLCFGPRYLYEALPFFLILSARGLVVTHGLVAAVLARVTALDERGRNRASTRLLVGGLVGLYSVSAFVTFPTLIEGRGATSLWGDRGYGRSYWGVDAYLGNLAEDEAAKPAIVFVRFDYPVSEVEPYLWYGSGFLHNSPSLDDAVLYARDLGTDNVLLMDYYPERTAYLYRGRLTQGRLYRLR